MRSRRHSEGFEPARVLEVEIAEPLPEVSADCSETGRRYSRALSLVRLHGQPLGILHCSDQKTK